MIEKDELHLDWEMDMFEHDHFDFTEEEVNKIKEDLKGVYIIWLINHNPPRALRLGQGEIKNRLKEHIQNKEILKYRIKFSIVFSYAKLSLNQCDNVERFLGDNLSPIVGDKFPDCEPRKVNLPYVLS